MAVKCGAIGIHAQTADVKVQTAYGAYAENEAKPRNRPPFKAGGFSAWKGLK
ncbi:MAG: hypothetical protein LBU32_03115 [Clostridiales bacterium]|nr:hypothetical protein [Clostridiales bacterium]